MGRRNKHTPADDLINAVARLPWWVGVALAVISFVGLRILGAERPAPSGPVAQLGGQVVLLMVRSLAYAFQYVIPPLCLLAAGISAYRQRKREALVANAGAADALDGMLWQEFEQLVGQVFRLQGYRVLETGGGGPDGGVDLVLMKGTEKTLVQCKQWRAMMVGVDVVRELYGVMAARGATAGIVVTSGEFSSDAKEFASGRNVRLVNGKLLQGWIRLARRSADGADRGPTDPGSRS